MPTVTVSAKGQLVIPKVLRERFGITTGSKVDLLASDGGLMLIPVAADPVESSRGMLKGTRVTTEKLLQERRRDRERESRTWARLRRPPR
jgi:AbrB family looped-hinge helix DNA binding protein